MKFSFWISLITLLFCFPFCTFSQLPEGFIDEETSSSWDQIAGFVFDEENRMFAWERAGRLYRVIDDEKVEPAILDISEEVAFFLDHGLLSVALHPNFINNGYVYLNYAVDRHYLIHYGTPAYDPAKSSTHNASIGRLTRYTLNKNNDFAEVVPGSRKVLIGTDKTNGVPLLHGSHGVGDVLFGVDGSLLVGYGDGSSFEAPDAGSHPTSYYAQGLWDGIITEKENIGAYRSQLVDCLNGKILRIDPETGEGLPSNPFYDETAPDAPRSRVWVLGLRNPFRMSLIPGTGDHNPVLGQPGELLVSDVGAIKWEELNHVQRPGQNFGWPLWEGFMKNNDYRSQPKFNQDAPNPLACQEFFYFHDLVIDSVQNQLPYWGNPCDPNTSIPADILRFTHQVPVFAYSNIKGNPPAKTEVAGFDGQGIMTGISMDQASPAITGDIFEGVCIIDGAFGTNSLFPKDYRDAYFFADYDGWIKVCWFDSLKQIVRVEDFHEAPGKLTHLDFHPENGCLYFIDFKDKKLHKVCFDTDPAPLLNLFYDRDHGPSPLTVQFDASSSRDPEGQPIQFHWDMGDGTTKKESAFSYTFTTEDDSPTPFPVTLTVTDSAGNSKSKTVIVSVNNSPPQVSFSSFKDGDYYAMDGINILPLEAEVFDLEHQGSELSYAWQIFLQHNTHFHPEPIDTNRSTVAYISPAGCEPEEVFFYRVELTVRDAAGLATHISAELLPNCDTFFSDVQIHSEFIQEKVYLSWGMETSANAQIEEIEVERAPDRLHFETIAVLEPNSSNTSWHNYTFEDLNPLIGNNVYRLKFRTRDGRYTFSRTTETSVYEGLGVTVYPNPTSSVIAFRFEEMISKASFELFDIQGKKLMEENWSGVGRQFRQHNVSAFQPGMYYFRLTNGNKQASGKLLIVR